MTVLIDKFGRIHRDMRISLTDRCNLRCQYCMPADFKQWQPSKDQLTTPELMFIVKVAISQGITSVRLTGGEPLLRPDIVEIVAQINSLNNAPSISLTTNGINLAHYAKDLEEAGLSRLNISLDTLNHETFKKLTNRNKLNEVLKGVEAAKSTNMRPIKINSVLLRGINDHEAVDLLNWSIQNRLELRFIEQMPLDAGETWDRQNMITADEIYSELSKAFTLSPIQLRGSKPAEEFSVNGSNSKVGIIASVTRPFCGACDRLRLTADGQLRSCLFSRIETNLRIIVRDPELSDKAKSERVAKLFSMNVESKLAGHEINNQNFVAPERPMSAIGG